MTARSVAVFLALPLAGCPGRFEVADNPGGITTGLDGTESSSTRGPPETTTGLSATSGAETFPPPPPTSGFPGSDSGFPGECDEGDIVCAGGATQPFLLVCEAGFWKRVPQSHSSDAGDCDGVCRVETDGALIASACIEDACVCDRPCPGSAKDGSWEDGYCANGSTYWYCIAGVWGSRDCDAACKESSAAAEGQCEAGAFWAKDEYYDTCLCDFSESGSCDGNCGPEAAVPDGPSECFCDAACEEYQDCCFDYYDVCGDKGLGPGDGVEISGKPAAPGGAGRLAIDVAVARSTWPSLESYPSVPPTLLEGLGSAEPRAVLAGLADAFAVSSWPNEQRWNRFGAIDIGAASGFVSLEGQTKEPLHRLSLGCAGGFIEAVRLLEAPRLALDVALGPATDCPLADRPSYSCGDDDHTGLHVLLNVRDGYMPGWTVELAEPSDLQSLRSIFRPSADPYYVSASHVARDGNRRYHHMMVVLIDGAAEGAGPIVFDVTGRRGVSARRVTWAVLSRYLGVALAESSRFRYLRGTNQIAVLHSDLTLRRAARSREGAASSARAAASRE